MKSFLALTFLQLKDKIDLSWTSSKTGVIRKIVFSILKFIGIAGITFVALLFFSHQMLLNIINRGELINLLIIVLTIYFVVEIFSVSMKLMESLYFAEDNKLLVTYPVSNGSLFISKILVYFWYEIKKSLEMIVPVIYGFIIFLLLMSASSLSFFALIMPIFVLPFAILIIVILGALISVPLFYLFTFIRRHNFLELIFVGVLVAGFITISILLINKIPQELDPKTGFGIIKDGISTTIDKFANTVVPIREIVYAFTGQLASYGVYVFNIFTLVRLISIIVVAGLLGTLVYFAIKPFFYSMLTKSFEFDKLLFDEGKKNKKHERYVTFVNKEMKLSFRDLEISGSYISVYIFTPVLLLLANRIFGAINKSQFGWLLTYVCNIVLILLPLLASNSMIATLYSREGRAAYIKKTKPIDPLLPLISKLIFNLALSIPSIIASVLVFGLYSKMNFLICLMFALTILLIQYAHIFYSASLDIMNPQNEVYATDGKANSNPNENVATAIAFIAVIVLALIGYFFLNESYLRHYKYDYGYLKLFLVALFTFVGSLGLFILKIKAYYYEK